MRFEVTINDKKYKAQYTRKTCRIYREQFYGDFLLDIQTGQEKIFTICFRKISERRA